MKLVGVENNIVNVGFGSNWLITSDKSINQNSYYFEVEFKSHPNYSTGYIGYLYKYPTGFKYFNNQLGIKLYYPSFTIEILTNGSNKIYLTYYNNNKEIRKIMTSLKKGYAGKSFNNIVDYLLTSQGVADQYMCLADFDSYLSTHFLMDKTYQDHDKFNHMSLVNIAEAGRFAADRSIEDYAKQIWKLKKVK